MRPRSVAILIVTFNNADTILPCLQSITDTLSDTPHDLCILDNSSTDQTVTQIAPHFPQATLTVSPTNLGFAAAVNALAQTQTAQSLLLLNPDTILHPGCVQALLDAAKQHPQSKIFGGQSFTKDGAYLWSCRQRLLSVSSTWLRAFGLAHLLKTLDHERLPEVSGTALAPTEIVEGSCLLIRRADWETLGGFDPAFFLYGEDQDLCLRAGHCATVPGARYTHLGGASSTAIYQKQAFMLSARAELARRYRSPLQQRAIVAGLQVGTFLRMVWSRLNQSDTHWQTLWTTRHTWAKHTVHPTDFKRE